MNYFQIHKNKKPKILRKNKFNQGVVLTALVASMGAISITTTNASVFNNPEIKKLLIFRKTLDTSIGIIHSMDKDRLDNFKKTGRYNLQKGEFKNRKKLKETHKKISDEIDNLIENKLCQTQH